MSESKSVTSRSTGPCTVQRPTPAWARTTIHFYFHFILCRYHCIQGMYCKHVLHGPTNHHSLGPAYNGEPQPFACSTSWENIMEDTIYKSNDSKITNTWNNIGSSYISSTTSLFHILKKHKSGKMMTMNKQQQQNKTSHSKLFMPSVRILWQPDKDQVVQNKRICR